MRIFYDVDTQQDFMREDGALYVPGAQAIAENLGMLMQYAQEHALPLLGSVDQHFGTDAYKEREVELEKWGGPFPDHCMDKTPGFDKIPETTPKRFAIIPHLKDTQGAAEWANNLGIAMKALLNGREVAAYFAKQHYDVFTNPAAELVLTQADVNEAVVYGVATDYCVKAAVLGMQERGIQTYVVTDAIQGITPEGAAGALDEMVAAGARLTTTGDVLEGRI